MDLMEHQLAGGGGGGGGHQPPHQQTPPPTAAQHLQMQAALQNQHQQQNPQQQPPPPPQLPCPRCQSSNTKFCYYNNYSLSQPRYLCKGCRRYWTHGGTLRNVPVGGGCRKSKRPKPARPATTDHQHLQKVTADDQNPEKNINNLPTDAVGSNLGSVSNIVCSSSWTAHASPPAMGSPYPGHGGGILSSLAAIQAINQRSTLGMADSPWLQGFALPTPSFGILQGETFVSDRPSGVDAADNDHQLLQEYWAEAGGLMSNNIVSLQPPSGGPPPAAWFWSINGMTSGNNGGTANDNSLVFGGDGDNKDKNKQININGGGGGGGVGSGAAANQRDKWPPDLSGGSLGNG